MNSKTKRQRRSYDRISLHYVSIGDDRPEIYLAHNELKEWRIAQSCNLGLQLKINGKTIWTTCLISTLIDIALGRAEHPHGVPKGRPVENIEHGSADYWPFACFDCADAGCAGVWVPLRVFQRGKEILFGVKRPLEGVAPGKKSNIRAYRFRRQEFLDALIDVVKFRIALENMMQKYAKHHVSGDRQGGDWLTDIFGLSVCADYQRRISEFLRDEFSRLLDLRLSMLD